jgi:ADP-ribose pyrophosphatase
MDEVTPTNSSIAWQGRSWSLRVERFQTADGQETETAYIDHPGAVVLVPLATMDPDPQILILRQYRRAVAQTVLELPAGTRGRQEPWLSCAQRELREETGHRAAQFESLGNCWPAPGLSNEVMALYLAMNLSKDPLPMDSDEEIEVIRLPLRELVAMALDGRLLDAKSVVGILRTAAHLQMFNKNLTGAVP